MKKYQTYFFDIDGTILKYRKFETYKSTLPELTPGALEKLNEVQDAGHMIVLTTARPQNLRDHTVHELENLKVPWDRLVMGLERGPRHLINDMDPNKPGLRAISYNIVRDEGLRSIDVM
jgi:ribonucleotide monophosphatase NagD (HAD superfamily)